MIKYFFIILVFLSSHLVFSQTREDRINILKDKLITISKLNTSNESEFSVVRKQLEPLIAELETLSKPIDAQIINQFSPGAWKLIWSDEKNMDPPGGPQKDLNHIYQYLDPMGWAYNFGVRRLPNGQEITFALRVQGTIINNEQRTEILSAYLRESAIGPSESVKSIANEIYEGRSVDFVERTAGRFPRGPIGAVATLRFKYLDEQIKIGTSNDVYTGENILFILERLE